MGVRDNQVYGLCYHGDSRDWVTVCTVLYACIECFICVCMFRCIYERVDAMCANESLGPARTHACTHAHIYMYRHTAHEQIYTHTHTHCSSRGHIHTGRQSGTQTDRHMKIEKDMAQACGAKLGQHDIALYMLMYTYTYTHRKRQPVEQIWANEVSLPKGTF